jgi:hypothetical protein
MKTNRMDLLELLERTLRLLQQDLETNCTAASRETVDVWMHQQWEACLTQTERRPVKGGLDLPPRELRRAPVRRGRDIPDLPTRGFSVELHLEKPTGLTQRFPVPQLCQPEERCL